MKEEIKRQWTEDLDSGNFRQGTDSLGRRLPDGTEEYCCLGVLEEQALKAGIVTKRCLPNGRFVYEDVETLFGENEPDCSSNVLTLGTCQWAGLNSSNPVVGGKMLAEMNDQGVPFPEISADIKDHL